MIEIKGLYKSYYTQSEENQILSNIHFNIKKGEWCTIMGPSGSGKSTLLNCISGLVQPSHGQVMINQTEIHLLNDDELRTFRRQNIGFVFQDFKLLPHYSVLDNVILPLFYDGDISQLKESAITLLNNIKINESLYNRLPSNLSGGEKQRVAIARALITNPDILICDEPTGNLDNKTREEIILLLQQLNKAGKTILLVTHDERVASQGNKTHLLNDGELVEKELMT